MKTPGFLPSLPSDPVSAPEDLCQRHPALCLLPFTHHSFLSSLSAQASFSRQPALISPGLAGLGVSPGCRCLSPRVMWERVCTCPCGPGPPPGRRGRVPHCWQAFRWVCEPTWTRCAWEGRGPHEGCLSTGRWLPVLCYILGATNAAKLRSPHLAAESLWGWKTSLAWKLSVLLSVPPARLPWNQCALFAQTGKVAPLCPAEAYCLPSLRAPASHAPAPPSLPLQQGLGQGGVGRCGSSSSGTSPGPESPGLPLPACRPPPGLEGLGHQCSVIYFSKVGPAF